jgi:hypothetical protein
MVFLFFILIVTLCTLYMKIICNSFNRVLKVLFKVNGRIKIRLDVELVQEGITY